MENIKNLSVIFTGNTVGLSTAFTKVMAESDALKANLAGTNAEAAGFGSKLAASLPAIGAAAAAAGVIVTGVSMKMAADFQQQMTYIRTDAGDVTDNINAMSQSILRMTSQFDPTTLTKGLYHIVSLGLRGADALNALNVAQKMASVGGANLEETTSALGAALVTGIKGVQDYSSAAGTLDAIIGSGNMRMDALVGALGTGALTVFKNAGLSLTDFGAALATLTDNGMNADEAATRLKMSIALMEAPVPKAVKALKEIGMTSTQLGLDMQTKGLVPALEDLQQHLLDTYGTTAEGKVKIARAISEMFGGGRSSAAIQTLLDQIDRVNSKVSQIGTQGTAQEFNLKVSEQQFTPMAMAKTAVDKIKSVMIEWGIVVNDFSVTHMPKFLEAVKQVFDRVANFLKPSLEALWDTIRTKLGPSLEKLWVQIQPIVPLLGEALVGAIWLVINGMNVLAHIISAVITAVADVIGWFKKLPDTIGGIVDRLVKTWRSFTQGVEDTLKQIKDTWNRFTDTLKNAWDTSVKWVVDRLTYFRDHFFEIVGFVIGFALTLPFKIIAAFVVLDVKLIELVFHTFMSVYQTIHDWIAAAVNWVSNINWGQVFHTVVTAVGGALSAVWDTITGTFGAIINWVTSINWGNVFKGILTAAGNVAGGIWDAIKHVFDSIMNLNWGGIMTGIGKGIANAIIDLINGAIKGAFADVPVLKDHVPHIPHFALGTDYAPGGLALVGEAGPELVQLPRGSQVMNNKDTSSVVNNHRNITIGTIVLGSADAVKEMFSQLDRDNLLVMKGLSPARGL